MFRVAVGGVKGRRTTLDRRLRLWADGSLGLMLALLISRIEVLCLIPHKPR